MKDRWIFLIFLIAFLASYFIPFQQPTVQNAISEAFLLLQEYAREHVLLCLIPAFFIAGAISVFVSKASVIKYFGAKAKKIVSYSIASVSGTILAVCSCTVLPLFAGIYTRGAGIGPATAFLYSGPAINILAIILTAKVLGYKLGLARAIGAVVFAVVIGLLMHLLFSKEEEKNREQSEFMEEEEKETRPFWKTILYFAVMVAILVFINWGKSSPELKVWHLISSKMVYRCSASGCSCLDDYQMVQERRTKRLDLFHLGFYQTDLSASFCRGPSGRFPAWQARP